MFWYNTGSATWRETEDLYVYHSSTWKQVLQCWIYDGINWRLTHTAPTSLDTATIGDTSCDPDLGNFRASWTYTSPNISDWEIKIEYSFNSGSSYTVLANNIDPTTSPYDGTVEGLSGFTSLDNTYFRINLVSTVDNATQADNSPQVETPSYPCV